MDCFVFLMLRTAVEVLITLLELVIGIFLIIHLWVIRVHNLSLEVEVLEV